MQNTQIDEPFSGSMGSPKNRKGIAFLNNKR